MSMQGRGPGRRVAAMIAAVTAAGVAVAAAACTPDATPVEPMRTASPPPSAPPPPTPTPTPTPTVPGEIAALPDGVKPTRPAGLDGPPSVDSATALGAYFIQLFPYSVQTNDVTDLAALSHPDCGFCGSVADDVTAQAQHSEHTVGGGIRISSLTATEIVVGHHFAVYATIHEDPSHEQNQFGTVTEQHPGEESFAVEMAVLYENGRWLVRAVSTEAMST